MRLKSCVFLLSLFSYINICAYENQKVIVLLFGKPGAGKGTYATRLTKDFNFKHISTGELLKDNIKQKTEIGKIVNEYIFKGYFPPDQLMTEMLFDFLNNHDYERIILDGFPRTLMQAEKLWDEYSHQAKILFIYLKASDEIVTGRVLKRLMCDNCKAPYHEVFVKPKMEDVCDFCKHKLYKRQDDQKDVISNRLKVFHEKTAIVVEYFEKIGDFYEINSERDINLIYEEITEIMKKYIK